VSASGGSGTYTFAVTAGTLPAGLCLNATTGVLSGTPTATGSSTFTITATDSNNAALVGSQVYSLQVNADDGSVIIADGQAGYAQTGDWSTEDNADDYAGTDCYARASGSASQATWQASGLAPGAYTVQLCWTTGYDFATNAPFAIYDGSTLLQTVAVDETQTPVGSTYGGATFQTVATVNITSGTLAVVLSNTGTDGWWIVANAVRIAPA
jgi:large repetitive protein